MGNLCLFGTSSTSWSFVGLEPMRAVLEYARMQMMNTTAFPPGDGHPVVIFPGLASNQNSIAPLREFCRRLGYTAYDWGLGVNTGPQGDVGAWIEQLSRHIREVTSAHGQQMSLIGWSLGGIYAREVAKKLTGRVRQVITIGTPFGGNAEQNDLAWMFRSSSVRTSTLNKELMARLRHAPEVPTTSIFSRSDGVVDWQACMHDGRQEGTEDIEVDGSHFGLGWNPEVLAIIADRLGQLVSGASASSTGSASKLSKPGGKTRKMVNAGRAPSAGTRRASAQTIKH